MQLRPLAANAPLTLTAPDMVKNGSSAVVAVELAGVSVILPGDATWETMKFVNTEVYANGAPPADCLALAIPHHGALRTAVPGYAPEEEFDKMNTGVVEKFAGNLKSEVVIASAGHLNVYMHPMVEIMDIFSTGVTDDPNDEHAWVGYHSRKGSGPATRRSPGTSSPPSPPSRTRPGIATGSSSSRAREARPSSWWSTAPPTARSGSSTAACCAPPSAGNW